MRLSLLMTTAPRNYPQTSVRSTGCSLGQPPESEFRIGRALVIPLVLLLMKDKRKKQEAWDSSLFLVVFCVCTPNPRLRSPLLGNQQGIPVSTKSLSQVLESAGSDKQRCTMVGAASVSQHWEL